MNEINLNLNIDETNIILNALGNQSYKQVFQLVQKIQQQAAQQIESENGQEEVKEKENGVLVS